MLVEQFRPGVMDRLGVGWSVLHEINPGLVILSITGFGHDGPEAQRPGYDQIAQGEAGLMSITGEPGQPTKVGVPIADLLAGMYGVSGVLAALLERHQTGRGRVVRTSLLAAVVGVHAFQGTWWTVAGEVPAATGNHHPSVAPYGLFRTGTGAVQLSVGSERQWHVFAPLAGLDPIDPRFARNADRVRNRDQLIAEIEQAFAEAPAEEWIAKLEGAGIPAGKVRNVAEVYEWEQTRSQGLLQEVDHATLGRVALPGPAVRFDGGGRRAHTAPPTLGQHTGELSGVQLDPAVAAEIGAALAEGRTWEGEFDFTRPDGSKLNVQATDSGLYDEEGTLVGVVSTMPFTCTVLPALFQFDGSYEVCQ